MCVCLTHRCVTSCARPEPFEQSEGHHHDHQTRHKQRTTTTGTLHTINAGPGLAAPEFVHTETPAERARPAVGQPQTHTHAWGGPPLGECETTTTAMAMATTTATTMRRIDCPTFGCREDVCGVGVVRSLGTGGQRAASPRRVRMANSIRKEDNKIAADER